MSEGKFICPQCRSHLVWRNAGTAGHRTPVVCGNNPVASRLDFKLSEERFCFWTGICERTKDGKILLKNQDGTHIREVYK